MIEDLVHRLNSPIKHPQDSVNQRQEAAFVIQDLYKRWKDLSEAFNKQTWATDYTEGFEEGYKEGKLSNKEYLKL